MSKACYALLILGGLSAPAWSHGWSESVGSGSSHHYGPTFHNNDREGPETRDRDGLRQCLVRRKTGRTECRTLAEWRRLARQIGDSQARPRD